MSSIDSTNLIVVGDLNCCKEQFSSEKLRSLINSLAQDPKINEKDPELNAKQELVDDFKFNPGDSFGFFHMNSEDAANRVIEQLDKHKLVGCEHLRASFVPNNNYGNSSDDGVKREIDTEIDPWGRAIDGTWESKGYSYSWDDKHHHYHETIDDDNFLVGQGGWYEQTEDVMADDSFIKNDEGGWAQNNYWSNNDANWDREPPVADEQALVKKFGEDFNAGQQQIFTNGIRGGGGEGRIYRSDSRGGNGGGRVYLELSGITLSDVIAHIKFGVTH